MKPGSARGVGHGLARWSHAYKQASANLWARVVPLSAEQSQRFASECLERVRRGRAYDRRRVRSRSYSCAAKVYRAAMARYSNG